MPAAHAENSNPEMTLRYEVDSSMRKVVDLEKQAREHERIAVALRQQAEELKAEADEYAAAADLLKKKT